jgi:hypothetical protein
MRFGIDLGGTKIEVHFKTPQPAIRRLSQSIERASFP